MKTIQAKKYVKCPVCGKYKELPWTPEKGCRVSFLNQTIRGKTMSIAQYTGTVMGIWPEYVSIKYRGRLYKCPPENVMPENSPHLFCIRLTGKCKCQGNEATRNFIASQGDVIHDAMARLKSETERGGDENTSH